MPIGSLRIRAWRIRNGRWRLFVVRVDPEKPSKGLVGSMGQLRGGGGNQEDEEMNIFEY